MRSRTLPAVLAAAALCATSSGCTKTVKFGLDLVEPCDQRQQSLNGVKTFRMRASDGSPAVVFTTTQPKPLSLPLSTTENPSSFVTIEGFAIEPDANVEAAVNNAEPRSIGRTLPFIVDNETQAFEGSVLMGTIDSFGEATSVDGACQTMTQHATGARGRHGHTATYVPTIKKVLIVGGAVWGSDGAGGFKQDLLGTVELYDPATGTFEDLAPLSQGETRAYHTATVLPDGRVLIAGGFSLLNGTAQANNVSTTIWDPARPTEYLVGQPLRSPRAHHTATYLAQGNIVVFVGGCAGEGCSFGGAALGGPAGDRRDSTLLGTNVEVFDVASGRILPATSGLEITRAMAAASAIGASRLLVSGGVNADGPVCNAEIFEIDSGSVKRLTVPSVEFDFATNDCPLRHAQVTIDDDPLFVAIIGGQTQAPGGLALEADGSSASPGSAIVRFFTPGGIAQPDVAVGPALMLATRAGHGAALLPNGEVLVIGGATDPLHPPAERLVFDADGNMTAPQVPALPLAESRDRAATVALPNGEVLFSGGYRVGDAVPDTVDKLNVYFPAPPPEPVAAPL